MSINNDNGIYWNGETGPQGPEGTQGPQGPQGPQGEPSINTINDLFQNKTYSINYLDSSNYRTLCNSVDIEKGFKGLLSLKVIYSDPFECLVSIMDGGSQKFFDHIKIESVPYYLNKTSYFENIGQNSVKLLLEVKRISGSENMASFTVNSSNNNGMQSKKIKYSL